MQPLKSLSTILAPIARITRLLKEEQPSNALSPMLVTLSGIIMSVKEVQLLNA